MKKIFLVMMFFTFLLAGAAAKNISEKVLANFKNTFPIATEVSWSENQDGYAVYFCMENTKCRIFYDTEGNVTSAFRYFKAESLPPMIAWKIMKRFTNKSIYGVTEISSNDSIRYDIILEDAKKWYHIEADTAGNCMVKSKFNKA